MSEVKFLADAHVHDEHGKIIESFKAGAVVDFSKRPASADRWIKRGVAISVADAVAEDKAKEEQKDAPNPPAGAEAGADGNSGGNAVDDSGARASGAAGGKPKR